MHCLHSRFSAAMSLAPLNPSIPEPPTNFFIKLKEGTHAEAKALDLDRTTDIMGFGETLEALKEKYTTFIKNSITQTQTLITPLQSKLLSLLDEPLSRLSKIPTYLASDKIGKSPAFHKFIEALLNSKNTGDCSNIYRLMGEHISFELLSDQKHLDYLKQSKIPAVILANHDCSPYDIALSHSFLSLIAPKQSKETPLPKMLISKNALNAFPKSLREILQGFLYIPVDPCPVVTPARKKENRKIMEQLAREITSGQSSLLTFPQGAQHVYSKELGFANTIQPGMAKYILDVLKQGTPVNLCALGINYKAKESKGYMYLEEPLVLALDKAGRLTAKGIDGKTLAIEEPRTQLSELASQKLKTPSEKIDMAIRRQIYSLMQSSLVKAREKVDITD
jgi:hypothetical protein